MMNKILYHIINTILLLFFYFYNHNNLYATVNYKQVPISTKNTFIWGTDIESAIPHVFRAPWNINEIVGFEKEIAESLAKQMNKKSIMFANNWDGLIYGLYRKMYDAILCGIEITPEHEQAVNFSIPYYITSQVMIVHKNNSIKNINECKDCNIGILRNTKISEYIKHKNNLKFIHYPSEATAILDVLNKRLDGFIIDRPIAQYYALMKSDIKILKESIGTIKYGIAFRKQDIELMHNVNQALKKLIETGQLSNIIYNWNMWNEKLSFYLPLNNNHINNNQIKYNIFKNFFIKNKNKYICEIKQYISYLPTLLKGALITIKISVVSMLIALILGFALAFFRIYGPSYLSILSRIYIEIFRGTPLLIQLYFIFYGLPSIGITLSPFTAGIITLGMNYAAFEAENYRVGILSVNKGQMEAAMALGMNHKQALKYVVIPQSFRITLPPLINDFISLLKDSSLVSVITIVDLTFAYNLLSTTYFNYFGIGIIVSIIYLLIGLPFIQIAKWLEKKLHKEHL